MLQDHTDQTRRNNGLTQSRQSKVFLLSEQTRKKKKVMQVKEGIRMCGQQGLFLQ